LREGDFKGDTKPPGHLSMSRRIFIFEDFGLSPEVYFFLYFLLNRSE